MTLTKLKTLFLLCCLLGFSNTQAHYAEVQSRIQFQGKSWDQVLKMAQKEGKPIFVDIYTKWCGPCKLMERNTFTLQEVYNVYNEEFINYKLDFETPEGQKFGARYGIQGVPVLLYFDSRGELKLRADGMQGKDQMIVNAQRVLKRSNGVPVGNDRTRVTVPTPRQPRPNPRYDPPANPPKSSMYDEIVKRYNTKQPYEKLFRKYATQQKLLGRMDNQANMELIHDLSDDIESKAMDMFINRQNKFIEAYGEDYVNGKVKTAVLSKIAEAAANKDEKLFKRALEVVRSFDMPQADNLAYSLKRNYYQGIGDRENFAKSVIEYMKKYDGDAPDLYNRSAWDIMTSDPSKSNLKFARKWAETSIAIDSQYYNNETYGEIMIVLGKQKIACEAFQEAIRIGRKTRRDTSTAEEKLNKFCR